MKLLLNNDELESSTINPSLPFFIIIDGVINGKVQVQSAISGSENFGLEYEFSGSDKSVTLPGIDCGDIHFKVVTENSGIKAYWGVANVSFPAR